MLLFYAFCLLPFVMLGVICAAIVGKVREGRYRKEWLGFGPEAPKPAAAVARVLTPIVGVLVWTAANYHLGFLSLLGLGASALVLGAVVYAVAAKRRASHPSDLA